MNKAAVHVASCQLASSNSQTIWTHKVQYLPTTVYWQQVLNVFGMKTNDNPLKISKIESMGNYIESISTTVAPFTNMV